MIQNRTTRYQHLGYKDYKETWDLQENLFQATVGRKVSNRRLPPAEQLPTDNHLLFVYHPHVYTLGKSGDEKNLLLDAQGLDKLGAQYYRINRGGDITYHGPGQLVGYPILDLDHFFTDIHKYLRFLEEAVIQTLETYGIEAGRIEGLTGVWIDFQNLKRARKICALGVKASRWVTMHGFAFNVNTDLAYFDHIVPCGIDDKAVTSLEKEIGRQVPIGEVENRLKEKLCDQFGMTLLEDS